MTAKADTASRDFTGFRPAALTFLRSLRRHNDREWFAQHRESYEAEVRAPLAALVEEVDVRLATVAPEIVGDPKRSLFRIHRDVRFSSDKSPYKTHAACWFFHGDAGRGVGRETTAHGGAGFYFDIGPTGSSLGGGIWEVRSSFKNRIAQTLFIMVDEEIVLWHGFIKKEQKTPKDELDLAKKRKKQYLQSHEKE